MWVLGAGGFDEVFEDVVVRDQVDEDIIVILPTSVPTQRLLGETTQNPSMSCSSLTFRTKPSLEISSFEVE